MPTDSDPIVLVVSAIAERPDADGLWYVEVADPASPFVDLYAWGSTLAAAREGLARTIWASLVSDADGFAPAGLISGRPDQPVRSWAPRVSAVRLHVTTRVTFSADKLALDLAAAI